LAAGPSSSRRQIHAGGRGKGGGVKVVKGPDAQLTPPSSWLGMTLVTHQTGPAGRRSARVLIEGGLQIARALSRPRHRSLDERRC
jgi:succinyl-CoA synthetase beta subunit